MGLCGPHSITLISVLTLTFITNDQPKLHYLYGYQILPNSNFYSAYSPISKIPQIFYFPPGKENDSVNTGKISPHTNIYLKRGTDHQATSITAKYRPMKIHKPASIIVIILERKHIRVNIHMPNIHQGQNINQVV